MHEADGRQQPGPGAIARPEGRERRSHQGHDDEEEFFHSRSAVSFRVSSESNARWMRSTMMPMTNTPTVRSSRNARLHQQRRRMDKQQAEQVDAVFQNQITADL